MIHIYPIPLREFEERLHDLQRFASAAETSSKGLHLLLTFKTEADRVAAALTLGEDAKPYRSSLLVCTGIEDEEMLENVRYLQEDLALRCGAYRFIWVRTDTVMEAAVARALLPLNPMKDDPRGVWERLA